MTTWISNMCLVLFSFQIIYSSSVSKNSLSKPQRLRIRNLNVTAIKLTWREPKPNLDCPLQSYIIKIKAASPQLQSYRRRRFPEASLPLHTTQRTRLVRLDATATQATITELSNSQTYNVRLVSVHCDGKEKATRWFEVKSEKKEENSENELEVDYEEDDAEVAASSVKLVQRDVEATNYNIKGTSQPLGQPINVRTKATANSMFVSWDPPEGSAPVRGYMIGYGEGVPDVNWQYLEGHRRNVTIKNLKKQTQFVISVRAFNDFEQGPVIYDLAYTQEEEDSPHAQFHFSSLPKPTKIKIKSLSPNSLRLQWYDESLGKQQVITDNRHYNVQYEDMSSSDGKTMSIIVKDTLVILENLLAGTRYELKVRSVLGSQMSAFSESISGRTQSQEQHASTKSDVIDFPVYSNSKLNTRRKGELLSLYQPSNIENYENNLHLDNKNIKNRQHIDDTKSVTKKIIKKNATLTLENEYNNVHDALINNETTAGNETKQKRGSEGLLERNIVLPVVVEPSGSFFVKNKDIKESEFKKSFKALARP